MRLFLTVSLKTVRAIASRLANILEQHDGIVEEVMARQNDERELAIFAVQELLLSRETGLTTDDLLAVFAEADLVVKRRRAEPNVIRAKFKRN